MSAPRVCFVVAAYNQARWVRAACEAALAQTHTPLHILFSDDGSGDDTFAIMTAVAEAYRGPHQVTLNRNPSNLGLIDHINRVHALADADLLVIAAGDDCSLPGRTAALVDAFHATKGRAFSFHSAVHTMDENGRVTGQWQPPLTDNHPDPARWATAMGTLIGASHAWTRPLFERFGPLTVRGAYEDLVLAYRAMLLGGLHYLDTPLVQYRQNVGLASGGDGRPPRERLLRSLDLKIAVFEQRRLDCLHIGRVALAEHLQQTLKSLELQRDIVMRQLPMTTALVALLRPTSCRAALKGLWARVRFFMLVRLAERPSGPSQRP
ncbi:glycosyltransferase [Polycyclovorans algicola]|uniref:glycosyltransferase n=1 Tax=Polycyclovorans algicola TaxID=616992 RepID=UPI0006947C6D|nr:glycosyltransferase [Polycyclovorans algicola]